MVVCCSMFLSFSLLLIRPQPRSTLFPYTTLFRSCRRCRSSWCLGRTLCAERSRFRIAWRCWRGGSGRRSEEHTSELQSRFDLVCRLLLEKKKNHECRALLQQPEHQSLCNCSVRVD